MLISLPELVASACKNIKQLDAKAAYTEGRASGIFVDVREPAETAAKNIPGSINIPRGVLEIKIGDLTTDPDAEIYVHCATGGRAALAAEQLQRIGYKNVTAISCALDIIMDVEIQHR
ncbi:MAG: phage shock protein E [Candidatus Azotimanducaceae bacterium]|jgi:phage shock protein E